MKKIIIILLFIGLIFPVTYIYGQGNGFEEKYREAGYTSIKNAKGTFEKHNKGNTNIPENLQDYLSFKSSHSFGQYNIQKSKDLRIEYVNKESGEIFLILVYPKKSEIVFSKPEKTGEFKDGKGQYKSITENNFSMFQFQSNKFSYILSSNSKSIKEEDFIKIANLIRNS
ncbi:hypothetical protein IQ781_27730 (plasmid) [Bacillus sp. N447-1]|uniref:hypothetical protein n=1 Tax=Bacillus sp. N447-1 TaxID=2789208 RepID=UPI001F61BFB6|nr:hypothetical protein [Bacillus sp. N447-1]UNT71637.1 hypothetical protein IQ781_27730 [Bacillus sp. N447-1]